MNTQTIAEIESPQTHGRDIIRLPFGLLGFEHVKKYTLLIDPEEDPFMWLEMVDNVRRAFLVVPPFRILPDYQPDISDDEVDFLQLSNPADAFLINIVTLRPNQRATVNLRGPIVINRRTLIGKQVILENAAQYALNHPIGDA